MLKAISSPELTTEEDVHADDVSCEALLTRTSGAPKVTSVPPKLKGFFTVQGSIVLPAPASLVYETLGDHSSTARVFRNVIDCQRSEDGRILTQSCKWTFLAFSGSFSLKLTVDKDPANRHITFSILESSFMKSFEGKWQVTPLDAAADQGESCLVEHELSMKPIVPVPPPISFYTASVLEKEVNTVLSDLEVEVQQQLSSQGCPE